MRKLALLTLLACVGLFLTGCSKPAEEKTKKADELPVGSIPRVGSLNVGAGSEQPLGAGTVFDATGKPVDAAKMTAEAKAAAEKAAEEAKAADMKIAEEVKAIEAKVAAARAKVEAKAAAEAKAADKKKPADKK